MTGERGLGAELIVMAGVRCPHAVLGVRFPYAVWNRAANTPDIQNSYRHSNSIESNTIV